MKTTIKQKMGLEDLQRIGTMTYLNKQGNSLVGPGVPMRITLKNQDPEVEKEESVHSTVVPQKGLIELWSNPLLKKNLIGSNMIWINGSFNFYLITFFLKYFPGNVYVNAIAFACADLFAYTCSGIVLKFLNVRLGLCIAYSIATASSLVFLLANGAEKDWVVPLIIAACRIGSSMSFNMGYVAVAKLFPTQFVTSVFGIVNLISHLVTIAAPMVAEIKHPVPMIAFAINGVSGIIFSSLLVPLDMQKPQPKK